MASLLSRVAAEHGYLTVAELLIASKADVN